MHLLQQNPVRIQYGKGRCMFAKFGSSLMNCLLTTLCFVLCYERERGGGRVFLFSFLFFLFILFFGRGRLRGILFRKEQRRDSREVGLWPCAGVCNEKRNEDKQRNCIWGRFSLVFIQLSYFN
jgi:hypothetical protein